MVSGLGGGLAPAGVTFEGGLGSDTIKSAYAWTLGEGIENLTLLGSGDIAGKGNAGANLLVGNAGANTLSADHSDDSLRGGGGKDLLIGGTGKDVFDFDKLTDSAVGAARDVVHDFVSGTDKVDLQTIDANAGLAGNQAFAFIDATLFSGKAGELRYNGSVLMGDVDGDGAADFHIQLGVAAVTAGDLLL